MNYEKRYDKMQSIKITVEGGLSPDRTLQLTMNPHSTLEEWIETFKTILIHQTFHEDTVKELFDEHECNCEEEDTSTTKTLKDIWKDEF